VIDDVVLLARAHDLFDGPGRSGPLTIPAAEVPTGDFPAGQERWAGDLSGAYRSRALTGEAGLADSLRVDAEATRLLGVALDSHRRAARDTAAVLAAARADGARADNPVAMRELMHRRIARLRAQRGHVRAAHRRARALRRALQTLRYAVQNRAGYPRSGTADPRAQRAVRAALSRVGCPYVWGAAGPDRFDCSGLVKWAYAQAGIPLHRTTYDQIADGTPVSRSQIRPGDLVFPHIGHVQMAIGHDLVVEAPEPGATVRIARLGDYVAIRRP
jgi:hypothetical protein